jgi:serine/threonine protein phosphatase PrpC
MSARETIVICQICEHENDPDQRFCDECGVELNPASAEVARPESSQALPADTVISGPDATAITVTGTLSLGRLNRYSCQIEEQPGMLLEEAASAPGFLEARLQALQSLAEIQGLWSPPSVFSQEGHHYACGPTPPFPTLADRVASDGPLPAPAVRKLAQALGALLKEIHQRSYLIRSFLPGRVWWDGEARVVVDNLDRMAALEAAGEDFQVVNGFSPPEAYGVGGTTVGVPGDLYSLGAILHFAASGAKTDLESRENFFSFGPLPPNLGDEVLQGTIGRLTAKNVADRPASVDAFLELLASDELPAPAPAPRPLPAPAAQAQPQTQAQGRPSAGRHTRQDSGMDSESDGGPCSYDVCLKSHVGCVRQINQDACLQMRFTSIEKSVQSDTHLVVMIDGMGGEAEGDKAASLALRTIAQDVVGSNLTLKDQRATSPLLPDTARERNKQLLERALKKANRTIYEYAERDIHRRGMGCTITACIFEPEEVTLGHVGDTRAYLWRDGELKRLTTDHSLVGRLVEMGQLTEEEARNSPQRSIIYRAMGTNPDVEVDLYHHRLRPGDRLMVSSDGVWEYFMNEELEQIIGQGESPEAVANRLVEICLSRGADDNATVAVVFAG